MISTRHRRNEEGAAASALLVAAVLIGVAIFTYMAIPLGTAVDAKAQDRTAADAAALAGAQGVREDLLAGLGSDGLPGSWTDLPGAAGLGRYDAEQYARYNGSTLVSYWFDPTDGTAHAVVEGHPVDGELSRSTAVARVDLPRCDPLDPPAPPAPPVPSEKPDPKDPKDPKDPGDPPVPTEPPPPPPPVDITVGCDGFDLVFQIRYTEDGGVEVHFPPGQLEKIRNAMDVRLVD